MSEKPTKSDTKLRQEALQLLRDPQFLFLAGEEIEAGGLVGERRNGVTGFLATLTAGTSTPVSLMVKAPSASGKSTLAEAPLRLLPKEVVIPRSGLSKKAPVHGKEPLADKVLYLGELRGGKEAQYYLRLLQSEGSVAYEYATVHGQERGTIVVRRSGSPVMVTTTTQDHIFEDDATRFLIISPDQSEEQTLAVLLGQLKLPPIPDAHRLAVMQKAVELLREHPVNVQLPSWFETVVEHVPRTLHSRRDFPRFKSLISVIARIRLQRTSDEKPATVEVDFSDYAMAYRLLNRIFSRTAPKGKSSADELVAAVATLHRKTGAGVAIGQLKDFLQWEAPTVYKHVEKAVEKGSLYYEEGTRRNNEKRLLPRVREHGSFLISPRGLLQHHPELEGCTYVDPLTGETKVIGRVPVADSRNFRATEAAPKSVEMKSEH